MLPWIKYIRPNSVPVVCCGLLAKWLRVRVRLRLGPWNGLAGCFFVVIVVVVVVVVAVLFCFCSFVFYFYFYFYLFIYFFSSGLISVVNTFVIGSSVSAATDYL